MAKTVKSIHESIATIGYFVVGLHAPAALLHHYVGRDNTQLRIGPRGPVPASQGGG